jgi:hydroxymethylpyrimidine/phosphomethylpyrimidine kinase
MLSALSIAGSDPTGGAGLQADLQVFRSFGVHGGAVPTALTIQDGLRVTRVLPVFPSALLDMLRTTLDALRPGAVKIGMLGTDDAVRNVILALAPFPDLPVVIDPVLAASDGSALLERRAYPALRDLAFGRRLLTPNWPEAEILVGEALPRRRDGEAAARKLLEDLRLEGVLLKGGHLDGDADDLLVLREGDRQTGTIVSKWLPGERIAGDPVHGTGCALSAAITAGLALGRPLERSVLDARAFVRKAIAAADSLPNGARILVHP